MDKISLVIYPIQIILGNYKVYLFFCIWSRLSNYAFNAIGFCWLVPAGAMLCVLFSSLCKGKTLPSDYLCSVPKLIKEVLCNCSKSMIWFLFLAHPRCLITETYEKLKIFVNELFMVLSCASRIWIFYDGRSEIVPLWHG